MIFFFFLSIIKSRLKSINFLLILFYDWLWLIFFVFVFSCLYIEATIVEIVEWTSIFINDDDDDFDKDKPLIIRNNQLVSCFSFHSFIHSFIDSYVYMDNKNFEGPKNIGFTIYYNFSINLFIFLSLSFGNYVYRLFFFLFKTITIWLFFCSYSKIMCFVCVFHLPIIFWILND